MTDGFRSIARPRHLSRSFLIQHRLCPTGYATGGEVLVLAASASRDIGALGELEIALGERVTVVEASEAQVDEAIQRWTSDEAGPVGVRVTEDVDGPSVSDVRDLVNQPPVIRFVNLLIRDAHDARASDIHLEAVDAGLRVRLRIDGALVESAPPPAELRHAIISRIKLLAELDIAERRRPQDGRIRVRLHDRDLDLRVSTVPTHLGESVVLRLLDRGGRPVELQQLGMSPTTYAEVHQLVAQPHGMVVVTGPTGSGKSTTLYAAMARRDRSREKIVTIEDPIEYRVDGITQIAVNRQAGVTFAAALRSVLRQDPDVIMVGEMRDHETAEIAVQAAMTGHLVFSTLHTNDAASAITRLRDLGVETYQIDATVRGIVAQRLVRRLCDDCAHEAIAAESQCALAPSFATLAGTPIRIAVGCERCRGTGFRGRVGLFEVLRTTPDDLLGAGEHRDTSEPRSGTSSLAADGIEKIRQGITTIEEVTRVLEH